MEFIQASGRSTPGSIQSLSALAKTNGCLFEPLQSPLYHSIVHTAKDLRNIQKYLSGPQRSPSGPQRPACREQSGPASVSARECSHLALYAQWRMPEQHSGTPSRAISTHGRFEPCEAAASKRWGDVHFSCTRGLARLWL